MTKIAAIIQARMASTRLPGKVLLELAGKPLLWHVIDHVRHVDMIDQIIVATTVNPVDRVILHAAEEWDAACFAGHEEDVLDRFYRAADHFRADIILRITADDMIKDPEVIHETLAAYLHHEGDTDYVSTCLQATFPIGIHAEVLPFRVLQEAWREADRDYQREHVTPYIYENPERYRLRNIFCKSGNYSHYRWTIDTPEDFQFATEIYNRLYRGKPIRMQEVLELLDVHPELCEINAHIVQKTYEAVR